MKGFLVANPKGGSGKSTLATNLAGYFASQRKVVMLGDIDRQLSSREWLASRPFELPSIETWDIQHDQIAFILKPDMDTLVIPIRFCPYFQRKVCTVFNHGLWPAYTFTTPQVRLTFGLNLPRGDHVPESRRLAVILRVTLKTKPLASELRLGENKILFKQVVDGSEEAVGVRGRGRHPQTMTLGQPTKPDSTRIGDRVAGQGLGDLQRPRTGRHRRRRPARQGRRR